MYVDGVYQLNALEEAAEIGFKAGYEDYLKGIDIRNAPYTFTTYGASAASLTARWYNGYSMGQVTAHRHQFNMKREKK